MELINTTDKAMTIRGVELPPGKPVGDLDAALFEKCDAMPEFERAPMKSPKKVKADDENQE